MVTPAARREAAAHLHQVYGVSQRRACQAIGADRSSVRYRRRRPDDGLLRSRLREIAAVRRRFGYRRLHLVLRREGLTLNHKRLRRIYAEERRQVRRRGGRKRALDARAPLALPQGPNQRWSMDFLHDQFSDGRRFRILAIVDDFTRECLALVADTSLSGLRVGRVLDAIVAERGKPAACVSDNGTELTSTAILHWSQESRVARHYLAPGKLGPFGGGKIRIAHDVGRRIGHRAAKSSRLTGSNGSSFPNLREPLPRSPPARSTGGRTHPPTWLGSSPPIPTSWSKIPTRSAAWDCCGFPEARPRISPLPSGNAGGSDNRRPERGRLPDVRLNRGHMIQTMHHSPGPRACHIFRSPRGPTLLVRSQSAACCSVPADCVA